MHGETNIKLAPISSVLGYKPSDQSGTKVLYGCLMCTICYTWHAYIEGRKKFSASLFVTLFYETCSCLYQWQQQSTSLWSFHSTQSNNFGRRCGTWCRHSKRRLQIILRSWSCISCNGSRSAIWRRNSKWLFVWPDGAAGTSIPDEFWLVEFSSNGEGYITVRSAWYLYDEFTQSNYKYIHFQAHTSVQ